MDILEDFLDFGNRKRNNDNSSYQTGDHHDDDHADHDDHDHHDDHNQYPASSFPQGPSTAAPYQLGAVCKNCSTLVVQGAKFCHGCGTAVEMVLTCASCGTQLPENAQFCPQCGFKNG